ncbi:hypothetical protein GYMLUDRAFT_719560 [Collybiopsis luxurians FD-317 M1]|nr:hypothetical protein GYMLUDRAFT_719560 [Collybiopsis luxurians FD-317 M1]
MSRPITCQDVSSTWFCLDADILSFAAATVFLKNHFFIGLSACVGLLVSLTFDLFDLFNFETFDLALLVLQVLDAFLLVLVSSFALSFIIHSTLFYCSRVLFLSVSVSVSLSLPLCQSLALV